MEDHENGSSTAMEKPSFMTKRRSVRYMSPEQLEERNIYYIHVLEQPGLYIRAEVKNAQRAAEDWIYVNLGTVKWN